MALNQHKQYIYAYSQSDSEIQTSRTKKDLIQGTMNKKTSSLCKAPRAEKKLKRVEEEQNQVACVDNNLISTSKMYALKKRLLLPVWLLEGVLLSLGLKEAWFDSIASPRVGKIFACPNHVNVKSLVPFFLIWHELVARIFNPNAKETTIKLEINKYISGTKKDIQEISKEIENIFSSPLKLFEIKPSKKSKTFTMSKKGSLNFIRHAQLENDVDGVWLTLSLTNSFKEICHPPELKDSITFGSNNIVSISPIVIQSMGARANLKKILNYLFLEFSKQESYSKNSNWNSFHIDCKKISHFHKDFLSTAPAFYDHGVLGWNIYAPNKKISDIKEMNQASSNRHEIVCSWQLSDQIKEAYEIEHAISEKILQQTEGFMCDSLSRGNLSLKQDMTSDSLPRKLPPRKARQVKTAPKFETPDELPSNKVPSLFPEPPEDELKKVREEKRIKKLKQEKEQAVKIKSAEKKVIAKSEHGSKKINKKMVTQTLFDDGLLTKKTPSTCPKPSSPDDIRQSFTPSVYNDLADNEFLVLVSEFYESLKPLQKRAFEKDRKGMSREQFKAYMSSILQRKKSAQL